MSRPDNAGAGRSRLSTSGTSEPTRARVRGRRWVNKEIERLDPETDYERIVKLIADYKTNDFMLNVTYCIGFMSNIMPATGTEVIRGTGKVERMKQTRYLDTVGFFREWLFKGPSHPDVRESIKRLNRRHALLARTYPDSFKDNDDWLLSPANIACGEDRLRDLVGAPRRSRTEQIASHHFWRDIVAQLESPAGRVHSFPADYEAMMEYVEEYEHRSWPPAPEARLVFEALAAQFNARFLPRALHPAGRTLILALMPPVVIERHGLRPPNKLGAAVFRLVFRLIFFGQDHFLPDPKISHSQAVASEKYQAWRTDVLRKEKSKAAAGRPS